MTEMDDTDQRQEFTPQSEESERGSSSGNHLPSDVDDTVRQAQEIAERAVQSTDS
jgi:hypothetical protein